MAQKTWVTELFKLSIFSTGKAFFSSSDSLWGPLRGLLETLSTRVNCQGYKADRNFRVVWRLWHSWNYTCTPHISFRTALMFLSQWKMISWYAVINFTTMNTWEINEKWCIWKVCILHCSTHFLHALFFLGCGTSISELDRFECRRFSKISESLEVPNFIRGFYNISANHIISIFRINYFGNRAVICCWPSSTQLFLFLGFGHHRDHNFVRWRTTCEF
jgi:hypothetical protein